MHIECFRNRSAACLWGFAVVWLGMLGAMSYVLVRDGPPPAYSATTTLVIGSLFWLGGIVLLGVAVSSPCVAVVVESPARVRVTWRYPFRTVRRTLAQDEVQAARVVEDKDSEGDPYYVARVAIAGGEAIDLHGSHDRAAREAACARFNQALFPRATGT